jgi:hypothetical protein
MKRDAGRNEMANLRLRSILRHKEPEFPKVCIPLETVKLDDGSLKSSFCGHVILTRGVGIYLESEFDSESKALEFSAEFVKNRRENGNI